MIPSFLASSVKGAVLTLSWTVTSCALACCVEKTAHRVLYRLKPQLYDNVPYAYGLDLHTSRRRVGVSDRLPPDCQSDREMSSFTPSSSQNELIWTDDAMKTSHQDKVNQVGMAVQQY